MYSVISRNEGETTELGMKLGRLVEQGDFIALVGELGSGKTRFVQGVARGMGVDADRPVTSPTYSILHIHNGRVPLFHFDLYRLSGDDDAALLGFDEYFYGEGVSIVEWAERLHRELPAERLTMTFSHLADEERMIEFTPMGKRYEHLVMSLFQ